MLQCRRNIHLAAQTPTETEISLFPRFFEICILFQLLCIIYHCQGKFVSFADLIENTRFWVFLISSTCVTKEKKWIQI